MKKNIYVLYGGKSVEHEPSLKSAKSIMNSINKDKYDVYPIYITPKGVWCNLNLATKEIDNIDELKQYSNSSISQSISNFLANHLNKSNEGIVFPALHGTNGEDGTIQGFLEILNIPYVGSGVLSSSLCIDKSISKDLLHSHNIPQVDYLVFTLCQWTQNENKCYIDIENKIKYPCYVKSSNLGSSIGINRVENLQQLKNAFRESFLYSPKLIVEKEILGSEVQISVIGNEDPQASLPGDYVKNKGFFDYNAKYIEELIPIIPANLDHVTTELVRKTAIKVFKILNCNGIARIDIFISQNNEIFVNEVNTMPSFTGLAPLLWELTDGTTKSQLIDKLIILGFDSFNKKNTLLTNCKHNINNSFKY